MEIIIISIICLAIVHFVYESIILPSIRLSLRFKLFTLRDRSRALMLKGEISNDVFRIQQSLINNSIRMLCQAYPSLVTRAVQEIDRDENMRKRVEKRAKLAENCESEEFQKITEEACAVFYYAVVANIGACCIYIFPIIGIVTCVDQIKKALKTSLTVPEGEMGKVFEIDAAFV